MYECSFSVYKQKHFMKLTANKMEIKSSLLTSFSLSTTVLTIQTAWCSDVEQTPNWTKVINNGLLANSSICTCHVHIKSPFYVGITVENLNKIINYKSWICSINTSHTYWYIVPLLNIQYTHLATYMKAE